MLVAPLTLLLLAGPVVLAFASGGYGPVPQAWGGLAAWLAVIAALVTVREALPRGRPALLALGGLAGLAAWTFASAAWAPLVEEAWRAGRLALLYLGALTAAAVLLRDPRARRWVEPVLAGGALVVVGYALSERLLPGVIALEHSMTTQGRLEQPLTYWNGLGALAALGIVLCARLAGDESRPPALRAAAAAAAAPLGLGLSLTVSRGALYAGVAGLLALTVAAGTRQQWRAVVLVVVSGALAALAAAPLDGVRRLDGSLALREQQGVLLLAAVVVVAVAAAVAGRALAAWPAGPLRLPRHAPALVLGVVVAGLALALALGADERRTAPLSAGAQRLTTFTSNRYAYWRVALDAFEAQPLRGVGAAGWRVWWRRERDVREGANDAHSLYLQTAAELGIIGLALLAVWLAGIALAARDALRWDAGAAAGPVAGCVVWAAHAALDWDWRLPAVTLPAVILAGALIAQSSSAIRGASRRKTATATTQVAR